jgi:hypothetical protein
LLRGNGGWDTRWFSALRQHVGVEHTQENAGGGKSGWKKACLEAVCRRQSWEESWLVQGGESFPHPWTGGETELNRLIDRNFINPSGRFHQEIALPSAANTMLQIE